MNLFTLLSALVLLCVDIQAQDFIRPNSHLSVTGVPPIPVEIAKAVKPYGDVQPISFMAWHPSERRMLVNFRARQTAQLHWVNAPGQKPEALTDYAETVRGVRFEPKQAKYLVLGLDRGGNEATQLYRMDWDHVKAPVLLTDLDSRHSASVWNKDKTAFLVISQKLDKGDLKAKSETTLTLLDPLAPEKKKILGVIEGVGFSVTRWNEAESVLWLSQYKSAVRTDMYRYDLITHKLSPLLKNADTGWDDEAEEQEDKELLVRRQVGEFKKLVRTNLSETTQQVITAAHDWDVERYAVSPNKKWLAVRVNEAGVSRLYLYDTKTWQVHTLKASIPIGVMSSMQWHPQLPELAFTISSVRSPADVYSLNVETDVLTRWTTALADDSLIAQNAIDPKVIMWPSFDGRVISGFMYVPKIKKAKYPVLINIHGGPEAQSRPSYLGRGQYMVSEMGLVVIYPNVRGSNGYGETFLGLDDGMKREDSVKDIGALLDWIAKQPELDATRVAVSGGSYGGYMSLATAVHYGRRIKGAIDIVGIANFVSFLERTESYRRDLRRVEYGDERDPEMRTHLTTISPLNNAERINTSMFIIHGKNDPRVPFYEAEQIVAKLHAQGTPTWTLYADNEGHGFAKRDNADFMLYSMITFLNHILK
jgi:dipeptidyl aminopeptidase/acylaminoacyl peptidase